MTVDKPRFFPEPERFRRWLERHHATAVELWVGFHKKHTGTPSITWPESVDEALCFGWIDGIRKTLDDGRYVIRFTPRKPNSTWSAVNIARAKDLVRLGRMSAAGLRAFEKRTPEKSAIYSYEQRRTAALTAADEKTFRANPRAWTFFRAQPAGYQRLLTYWIISAKRDETRAKRLARLIADSAAGRRIG
jgi:uncharacterized protein YdeI (YjbR/CyaY-like superfamily)